MINIVQGLMSIVNQMRESQILELRSSLDKNIPTWYTSTSRTLSRFQEDASRDYKTIESLIEEKGENVENSKRQWRSALLEGRYRPTEQGFERENPIPRFEYHGDSHLGTLTLPGLYSISAHIASLPDSEMYLELRCTRLTDTEIKELEQKQIKGIQVISNKRDGKIEVRVIYRCQAGKEGEEKEGLLIPFREACYTIFDLL